VAASLDTPLTHLKGIGPGRAAELARAGLHTIDDLLARFPLRYEDRGQPRAVASLEPGATASVAGCLVRCGLRPTRRPGFTLYEAVLRDETGDTITAVWFNQRFLRDVFRARQRVVLFGKVETRGRDGLQLANPQYEILAERETDPEPHEEPAGDAEPPVSPGGGDQQGRGQDLTVHTGRIVPVYERVASITPKMQRALVHAALESLPPVIDDPMPDDVRERRALPLRGDALRDAHFPGDGADLAALNAFRTPAQVRLIYEEFFLFQLGVALRKRSASAERKPFRITVDDRLRAAVRDVLPFRLTAGQREAVRQIVTDMRHPHPMNRLLQGDVGAGKTIVALVAALVAMENGLQVAFMAPTEVLAEQHYGTIRRLLARARFEVALLSGRTPPRERRGLQAYLATGAIELVVGTHALVQDAVSFGRLGLVIVDEQHRFGVLQRATLREKGLHPDVLVMTATPIPRTLALTAYGDLDVSVIRDLPPGRTPIRTTARPSARRAEVHDFVRREVEAGRQAYIVYPLVEESEKIDVRAATAMADHLAQEVFPALRVGLLHGRLPPEAKERVMAAFASGGLDILVATTVIEVGLDVPNASVMLVEHAERFGLSQLHQLRGRVGRGSHQSSCVLLYEAPLSDTARARLKALTETGDGFAIAERDLELRGPGDFFGTRQSGVPTLRTGDLLRDRDLMEQARQDALEWLDHAPAGAALVAEVRRTWGERFGLGGVG
jgi:ATP-dependent DNA helicase RecG